MGPKWAQTSSAILCVALLLGLTLSACGGKSRDNSDAAQGGGGGTDAAVGGTANRAGAPEDGKSGASELGNAPGSAGGDGGSSDGGGSAGGEGGEGGALSAPGALPGPPRVVSVTPADQTLVADRTATVELRFSEPLDRSTITSNSVQITDENGAVVGGALSYEGVQVTFTPGALFELLGHYTVSVATTVKDESGTPMAAPFMSAFTVRDGVWRSPEQTLQNFDVAQVSGLQLSSDGAGHAVAVWTDPVVNGTTDVYVSLFGETTGWATPMRVNPHESNCAAPAVSMNSRGDAIVGWIETDPTFGFHVQARRYVGGAWEASSTQIDLSPAPNTTPFPDSVAVAMTGHGDAHVAWSSRYLSADGTQYYATIWARHANPGGVWDATTTALHGPQLGNDLSRPNLAFDAAGNGFAAYQYSSGAAGAPETNTEVMRYTAADNTWRASNLPATAGAMFVGPVSVATSPAGEAVVSWLRITTHDPYNDTCDLLASHFDQAWSPPTVISSATTYPVNSLSPPEPVYYVSASPPPPRSQAFRSLSSAVWTGTSFLVTWSQQAGQNLDGAVYANEYTTSWGSASVVSKGAEVWSQPSLASDGRGNALAVWSQPSTEATPSIDSPPFDVVSARFGGSTGQWFAPVYVSSDPAGAGGEDASITGVDGPAIVILGDGSAVSAWLHDQGNEHGDFSDAVRENVFE